MDLTARSAETYLCALAHIVVCTVTTRDRGKEYKEESLTLAQKHAHPNGFLFSPKEESRTCVQASQFSRNTVLSSLRRHPAFSGIQEFFTSEKLKAHDILQEPGLPIRQIYFPISGMVSTVAEMTDGSAVEVACVGCEGVVNWQALFGAQRSTVQQMGQVAGEMLSIEKRHLLPLGTHPAIAKYVGQHTIEVTHTAACNSQHSAEQRLARWLLLASDKTESPDLPLTQEFMAMMLGSRRSTVTIVAGRLQQAGLIEYRRGKIHIIDRLGLESAACECYAIVNNGAKS